VLNACCRQKRDLGVVSRGWLRICICNCHIINYISWTRPLEGLVCKCKSLLAHMKAEGWLVGGWRDDGGRMEKGRIGGWREDGGRMGGGWREDGG